MKTTLILLAAFALSTSACARSSEPAEGLDDDKGTHVVRVDSENTAVHTASKPAVVAPSVRVEKNSEVRVDTNGTKVRTGGGNTDVKTSDGKSVKVRDNGNVDVGGVKVEGNKVTVPGVATVTY